MPIKPEGPAPYGPPSAVLDIIDRYRHRGMTKPITPEVLARAGVSDSLLTRVFQTLVGLELIDQEGNPTETLESLRRAKEDEFKDVLAAWIRAVYADILGFIEPSDSETDIRDAFRSFNPVGQQSRMVALFLGLSRAAGLRPADLAKEARPKSPQQNATTARSKAARQKKADLKTSSQVLSGSVPPAIAGLLASLPAQGRGWTAAERDKFIKAFEAMLDFTYPLVTKSADEDEELNPLN